MLSTILENHYAVDWRRQLLAFAYLRDCALRQFTTSPALDGWPQHEKAEYMSPTTYHRFFSLSNPGLDADRVDMIPAIFADIDYRWPEERPHWGEIHLTLLELGIPATLIVQTPNKGFHLWWFLKQPLRTIWKPVETIARRAGEEARPLWAPTPAAVRALSWWRSVSHAVHHALISRGIPADTIGAGTPARLLRVPNDANTRYYDPANTWTMQQLTDTLEGYFLTKRLQVCNSKLALAYAEGAPEGVRNATATRLALLLAAQHLHTPEAGVRALYAWCDRCTPPYPHREALSVWRWALRRAEAGEVFAYAAPRVSERTRSEQGRYMRAQVSAAIREKIAAAIVDLQQGGVDPFARGGARLIAAKADIPLLTVRKHLKDISR